MTIYTCTRCNNDVQDDDVPCHEIDGQAVCCDCDTETCPECCGELIDAVTCVAFWDELDDLDGTMFCHQCALKLATKDASRRVPHFYYNGLRAVEFLAEVK